MTQPRAGKTALPCHPGLQALRSYPLLQAINERRTRRVAEGCSILAGPLSHQSTNAPRPLTLLEEAILICCTGLTGVVMHDGPLKKPSGAPEDLGSMFSNILARSGPSADNCQATSLFMINDEGIWLLKRLRGRKLRSWWIHCRARGTTGPRIIG